MDFPSHILAKCKVSFRQKIVEVVVLSHNWEPRQADHAARPLLYQHYESLVLQHQKRANKTAETEPR